MLATRTPQPCPDTPRSRGVAHGTRTSPTRRSSRSSRAATTSALGELYDRVGRVAYGIAYRILRDERLAEDAVQEGFLAVWRSAAAFRAERAKASTWIVTLVHRRAVDIVRREERRRAEPLDADAAPGRAPIRRARPRTRPGSASSATACRRRSRTLPDAQREAIELAYYGGYSQSELAERLGVPLGTIKSRMFAGLARLRELLDERRNRGIMDAETHELIAGYALDALDDADRARAEELLRDLRGGPRGASLAHGGRRGDGDGHRRARAAAPASATGSSRLRARSRRTSSRSTSGGARGSSPCSAAAAAVAACAALVARPVGRLGLVRSRRGTRRRSRESAPRPRCSRNRVSESSLTGAAGRLVVGRATAARCSSSRASRPSRPARRTRCG